MKAINLKFGAEKTLTSDCLNASVLCMQVEQALRNVNGRAEGHTYTSMHEINALVKAAEARLSALDLPKPQRAGAVFVSTSGEAVPSAYKYCRTATTVRLERRTSGWFLTSIVRATISKEGDVKGQLFLTKGQAAEAVERFTERSFLLQIE